MKKISFYFQLYFLILFALTIPTVILTSFNSRSIFSYAQEKTADSLRDNTITVSSSLERILFDIVKSTLRLINSSSFRGLRGLDTYDDINENIDSVLRAMEVGKAFSDLLLNETLIHSAFFIVEGEDYLVTSDRGIVVPENYRDQIWLIREVKRNSRINGFWVGRRINSATVNDIRKGLDGDNFVDVISYVYPMKTLASSIKGTIVINLYEKQLNSILNPSGTDGENVCILADRDGKILIHPDPRFLGKHLSDLGISIDGVMEGETFLKKEGDLLTHFLLSSFGDWVFINQSSLKYMLYQESLLRRKMIFLAVFLLVLGIFLTRFFAGRILQPMKDLVRFASDSEMSGASSDKNELEFLQSVFRRVQERSRGMADIIKEGKSEKRSLLLARILDGAYVSQTEKEELKAYFCYSHFLVQLWEIDKRDSYLSARDRESNGLNSAFMRDMIYSYINIEESVFFCLNISSLVLTVVINLKSYDQTGTPQLLYEKMKKLQEAYETETGYTLSVGVSGVHCGLLNLGQCRVEAGEALRGKLLHGAGSLVFWKEEIEKARRYFYPHNSVEKIVNFLASGGVDQIEAELGNIESQIRNAPYVSYDNVMLIYNQIIGITLKFLVERNINTARVFGNCGNVYEIISRKETLREIHESLMDFFRTISSYLSHNDAGLQPDNPAKILSYIDENYRGDIDFEIMADRLGISYSYMRKITREMTGKSLLDCINTKRIEAAKELLIASDRSQSSIARSVGYRNSQSLGRFFKKYEGITPSEYRRQYGPKGKILVTIDC